MRIEKPLKGKVIVITGGGRGIGRASALKFASAGASVVVAARTGQQIQQVAKEIESLGVQSLAKRCDVTDYRQCVDLMQAVLNKFGRIDILMNNAGGGLMAGNLVDCSPKEWSATIVLNLVGTFNCCHAAIPHMTAPGGKVINVGSGTGHSAQAGVTAYGAAKAGVSQLTRSLSEETWGAGIDVNELLPGPVDTELARGYFSETETDFPSSEQLKQPDEVAELAVWLGMRPEGGPTGQTFSLSRRPIS